MRLVYSLIISLESFLLSFFVNRSYFCLLPMKRNNAFREALLENKSNGLDWAALHLFKMIGQTLSNPIYLLSFRFSISRSSASNENIAFPSSLLVQVLLAKWWKPISTDFSFKKPTENKYWDYQLYKLDSKNLHRNQIISVVILLFVTCLQLMYEYNIFGSVFESKIDFESTNLAPYVCFQLLTHCSVLSSVPGIVARNRFKFEPEMRFLFNSFF